MEQIKSNFIGKNGVAIHNGMKLKVTIVGEFFSHNKNKFQCEAESISGKITIPSECVVFQSDF